MSTADCVQPQWYLGPTTLTQFPYAILCFHLTVNQRNFGIGKVYFDYRQLNILIGHELIFFLYTSRF